MSLQIWLPLNGDIKNQGLVDWNPTIQSGTTASYVDGKIGKALNAGGITMPASVTKQILNNNEFSYACWIYPNGAEGSTSERSMIFGNGEMSSLGGRQFSLFQYPTANDLHFSWQNYSGGSYSSAWGGVITGALPSKKWTHIAMTYNKADSEQVKFYINGVHKTGVAYNFTSSADSFEFNTQLIHNSPYHYLNDVRLYDHALSEKEVKELSKGLVLHYKLSNQYETGQMNKYSSPYSDGECSSSSFTKTKLINERGYNYKLTRTGDGTNSWPNWNVPNYSFTAGKTYYYSVKIRCNKWTSGNLVLRASRSNNDWVTNGVTICSPALADGKWHEYYTHQIVNENYDRSGTTVTSNPVLEFYCSNQNGNGTVYDMDFDVKDVQVVESDCYVPFIENSFIETTIYDCSGYGNNGITNNIIVSSDSARYSTSYIFNGSNSYIKTNGSLWRSDGATELSINFWASMDDWTTFNARLYSCTEGGGYNVEPSGSNVSFSMNAYTDTAKSTYKYINDGGYCAVAKSSLASGWHMFTYVYTTSGTKLYVDGNLKVNNTYTSYGVHYNATAPLIIGAEATGSGATSPYFNGKMSDFKLFYTALSADDIQELYHTAASIDNQGNLYSYEVVEQ